MNGPYKNSESVRKRWRESHARWRARHPQAARENDRRYRERHAPRIRSYLAQWKKTNSDRYFFGQIRLKYGLSREAYETILKRQGSRCAICRSLIPGRGASRFFVDHDHRTGQVRGLVCNKCNAVLGMADDGPVRLLRAAEYLGESAGSGTTV